MKIHKILIANRGEIACRIIRTCKEMGIATVSIYTVKEKGLPHVTMADEAYCLEGDDLRSTYLNSEKIISIAQKAKAQAIHPGYGFLSEKEEFASKVTQAGLVFIGPSSTVIKLMGDKKESKVRMEKLGIPLIPGYHGDKQDPDSLKEEAKKIGLPVLIKASAGGGGKGMRLVQHIENFVDELEGAKREALRAFGDDTVLLEKYITGPRHIEFQVFGDQHGNYVHLFERECSIQRRHQKILEETPSTALDDNLREAMGKTAVEICRGINYTGAGTVEFILAQDKSFYFLEMNTRLQVEHPITEKITGVDLVRWQILVASGIPLPKLQDKLRITGHAMEVRMYAENPEEDFLPTTGIVRYQGHPNSHEVRLDTGISDGTPIGIDFDPMLSKVIAYAENREHCIARLRSALYDLPYLGIQTNRRLLLHILSHPEFLKGLTYTSFIQDHKDELLVKSKVTHENLALAALIHYMKSKRGKTVPKSSGTAHSPGAWETIGQFRNV